MKVKLSEIKPATPRVRKELNLDKLDELAASISETGGVIVPVKLRKNGDGYTTVYGHRRIEAARQAGFDEIEAWIADVDDEELLQQALIENVVREDMSSVDVGEAFKRIKDETGWTNEQIGAKFGMSASNVAQYLQIVKPEIREVIKTHRGVKIPARMVQQISDGLEDKDDTPRILDKAIKEGLTSDQARKVSEEYTRAKSFGGQRAANEVLKAPWQPATTDPGTEYLRKHKGVKAEKVKGEPLFQWLKDARLDYAESGIRAVSELVAAIALEKRDRAVGKRILLDMRKRVQTVLDQIDEVLDGFDS